MSRNYVDGCDATFGAIQILKKKCNAKSGTLGDDSINKIKTSLWLCAFLAINLWIIFINNLWHGLSQRIGPSHKSHD